MHILATYNLHTHTLTPHTHHTHTHSYKVFLKYYHVERLLQILNNYDRLAVKIQKVVRGWLSRRKVAFLKQERRYRAAVMIQAGESSSYTWVP